MSDGFPTVIRPMLAESAEPFDSPDYIIEPKWDGLRCLAFRSGDRQWLQSRTLRDMTARFPELSTLCDAFTERTWIVDGEIVVFDADGRPNFDRVRDRNLTCGQRTVRDLAARWPANLVVFDLLYAGDRLMCGQPFEARRERLEAIWRPGPVAHLSPMVPHSGRRAFEACKAQGLEGIVAKRRTSPYRPGRRSQDWIKSRVKHIGDFPVIGYTEPDPGRFGSLLLAEPEGTAYCGHVGTGFSDRERRQLMQLFRLLGSDVPHVPVPADAAKGSRWVRPQLVATVEYLTRTDYGRLRHPVYKGMKAADGRRESLRPGAPAEP